MMLSQDIAADLPPQLKVWFSQKPVLALMGEFSSGKSTLLNMLVGRDVLPTQVTATPLPVVWITYGTEITYSLVAQDGEITTRDDLDLGKKDLSDYALIRVSLNSDLLKDFDIIDTPGISDAKLAFGTPKFAAQLCDFVIWCTVATQAWRQSERAVWKSVADDKRGISILAVTRVDKIRKASDLDKVLNRCRTEASSLFRDILPLATVKAAKAMGLRAQGADDQSACDQMWSDSGAADLLAAIETSVSAALTRRAELGIVPLPDRVEKPKDVQDVAPPPAKLDPLILTQSAQKPTESTRGSAAAIAVFQKIKEDHGTPTNIDQVTAVIDHFMNTFMNDCKLPDEHYSVLLRALAVGTVENMDFARTLSQVEHEIADFSEGPWCQLDQVNRTRAPLDDR